MPAERALDRAQEALRATWNDALCSRDLARWTYAALAETAIEAWLEALVEQLPEHVILAGVQRAFDRHITQPNDIQRQNVEGTFKAMIAALRDE